MDVAAVSVMVGTGFERSDQLPSAAMQSLRAIGPVLIHSIDSIRFIHSPFDEVRIYLLAWLACLRAHHRNDAVVIVELMR